MSNKQLNTTLGKPKQVVETSEVTETQESAPASIQEAKVMLDTRFAKAQRANSVQMTEAYKKEDRVRVSLSAFYRPYFGNVMSITINGVMVCVPCDGASYEIPDSFAAELHGRVQRIERQLQSQGLMSNAKDNFESYPGELNLIRSVD